MSPALWITLIASCLAAGVGIVSAILAFRSAAEARRANRVSELEDTIEELHTDRHQLWLYVRQLIDHIYRNNPPPPPAPPPGLFT